MGPRRPAGIRMDDTGSACRPGGVTPASARARLTAVGGSGGSPRRPWHRRAVPSSAEMLKALEAAGSGGLANEVDGHSVMSKLTDDGANAAANQPSRFAKIRFLLGCYLPFMESTVEARSGVAGGEDESSSTATVISRSASHYSPRSGPGATNGSPRHAVPWSPRQGASGSPRHAAPWSPRHAAAPPADANSAGALSSLMSEVLDELLDAATRNTKRSREVWHGIAQDAEAAATLGAGGSGGGTMRRALPSRLSATVVCCCLAKLRDRALAGSAVPICYFASLFALVHDAIVAATFAPPLLDDTKAACAAADEAADELPDPDDDVAHSCDAVGANAAPGPDPLVLWARAPYFEEVPALRARNAALRARIDALEKDNADLSNGVPGLRHSSTAAALLARLRECGAQAVGTVLRALVHDRAELDKHADAWRSALSPSSEAPPPLALQFVSSADAAFDARLGKGETTPSPYASPYGSPKPARPGGGRDVASEARATVADDDAEHATALVAMLARDDQPALDAYYASNPHELVGMYSRIVHRRLMWRTESGVVREAGEGDEAHAHSEGGFHVCAPTPAPGATHNHPFNHYGLKGETAADVVQAMLFTGALASPSRPQPLRVSIGGAADAENQGHDLILPSRDSDWITRERMTQIARSQPELLQDVLREERDLLAKVIEPLLAAPRVIKTLRDHPEIIAELFALGHPELAEKDDDDDDDDNQPSGLRAAVVSRPRSAAPPLRLKPSPQLSQRMLPASPPVSPRASYRSEPLTPPIVAAPSIAVDALRAPPRAAGAKASADAHEHPDSPSRSRDIDSAVEQDGGEDERTAELLGDVLALSSERVLRGALTPLLRDPRLVSMIAQRRDVIQAVLDEPPEPDALPDVLGASCEPAARSQGTSELDTVAAASTTASALLPDVLARVPWHEFVNAMTEQKILSGTDSAGRTLELLKRQPANVALAHATAALTVPANSNECGEADASSASAEHVGTLVRAAVTYRDGACAGEAVKAALDDTDALVGVLLKSPDLALRLEEALKKANEKRAPEGERTKRSTKGSPAKGIPAKAIGLRTSSLVVVATKRSNNSKRKRGEKARRSKDSKEAEAAEGDGQGECAGSLDGDGEVNDWLPDEPPDSPGASLSELSLPVSGNTPGPSPEKAVLNPLESTGGLAESVSSAYMRSPRRRASTQAS